MALDNQTQAKRDKNIARDVVKLNQEAVSFYHQAAKQVEDYNIRHIFKNMADIREHALTQLEQVGLTSSAQEHHSWIGSARGWYSQAKARFSQHPDEMLVQELIDFERHLLSKTKSMVLEVADPALKGAIASISADMQMCVDQLSSCKSQAEARSHLH